MARSDLNSLCPRRVVVIKPSSLGDVVHALPVAAGLRLRYPEAHLAWLAKPEYAGLVACSPDVDEVIDLPAAGGPLRRWRGLRQAGRRIREGAFDLALDLQGLFRSGWVGWSGRVPVRVGLSTARECAGLFYTHTVAVPTMEMHAVERYWLAGKALGCAGDPPPVRLNLPDGADERVADLLGNVAHPPPGVPFRAPEGGCPTQLGDGGVGPLAVLLPGARWRTKRWASERFARVADALTEECRARVVVAGGEADREAGRVIGRRARCPVLDLTGRTTLVELAALLGRATLVVSVDSGPMHLAAALGRPVVAIFGPTNARRTGPYGPGHAVIAAPVDCRPCYRRRCRRVRCLEAVSAEEVIEKAVSLQQSAISRERKETEEPVL